MYFSSATLSFFENKSFVTLVLALGIDLQAWVDLFTFCLYLFFIWGTLLDKKGERTQGEGEIAIFVRKLALRYKELVIRDSSHPLHLSCFIYTLSLDTK